MSGSKRKGAKGGREPLLTVLGLAEPHNGNPATDGVLAWRAARAAEAGPVEDGQQEAVLGSSSASLQAIDGPSASPAAGLPP